MLKHMEVCSWLEDSPNFAEHHKWVAHRTEGECRQCSITGVVGELDGMSVKADHLDSNA